MLSSEESRRIAKRSECELPARSSRWVHLVLLDKLSPTVYQATALSASCCLDPLHEDGLVMERQRLTRTFGGFVTLDPKAVAGAIRAQDAALHPEDEPGSAGSKAHFRRESFVPGKTGRDAMLEYFEECRLMYEQLTQRPLADEAGTVTVLKKFGVKKQMLGMQTVFMIFPFDQVLSFVLMSQK